MRVQPNNRECQVVFEKNCKNSILSGFSHIYRNNSGKRAGSSRETTVRPNYRLEEQRFLVYKEDITAR
jgi:hypothetical protein